MLPSDPIRDVDESVMPATGPLTSSTATTLASLVFGLRMVKPLGPTPNLALGSLTRATVCGVPNCSFDVEMVRTDACVRSIKKAPPAPWTASSFSPLSVSGSSCTFATTWPAKPSTNTTWRCALSTSHFVAALDVSAVGCTPSLLKTAMTDAAATAVPSAEYPTVRQLTFCNCPIPPTLLADYFCDGPGAKAYKRFRRAVRMTRCWRTPERRPASSAWQTGNPAPSCTRADEAPRVVPRSRHLRRSARIRVHEPTTGST